MGEGNRTDVATFHVERGAFAAMMERQLTKKRLRIDCWSPIFHFDGISLDDSETKPVHETLWAQLFAPALLEQRRLLEIFISSTAFILFLFKSHQDNESFRIFFPALSVAAMWMLSGCALASCYWTYRYRASNLEGWRTVMNQLWNSLSEWETVKVRSLKCKMLK